MLKRLYSADLVQWVKETFVSLRSGEKEIPQLRKLKPTIEVETIVGEVAGFYRTK